MGDYNLAGLSTRSFEQLIQALAAKVIGPHVVIFGDGPDGGREVTFDGPVSYPSAEHGWRGYGVIQAKFKQRPEGSPKDGEWTLAQLESELKKFVDPQRELRRPEYYIFATNVVLTPVQDTGSKDKVAALIKRYQRRLKLKGYDIWDYDKLRVFLDAHEGIRRSYAAWITPGDVLAEALEWLAPQQPDFGQIIANFVQKELLADQYANLEQAGRTADERIPLASVFVDLPVAEERENEPPDDAGEGESLKAGFIAHALDVALERLDPETVGKRPLLLKSSLSSSRAEPGRFVLIGGPGQGKTTVGQFICQLFRVSILKDKPSHTLSREAQQALREIDEQCAREQIVLPTARRFPIRVVLNDFAAKLASSDHLHVNSLLSYVVDRIRRRTDRDISADDFRSWLAAYPWLLILDGLDEVPSSSNRDEVLAAVNDFWIDVAGSNADVLVIATTRPQGYNDDFAPDLYQHLRLLPLSTARALHYANRLAALRYPNDQDRRERIVQRLQRAANNQATARLMRSPLQVTIMTTLVDQMGQPPQERWSLFNEYYRVIYKRELERDIPAAAILRDQRPDIDAIHRHVGLLLQVESERSGGTDARLSAARFEAVVRSRLRREGHMQAELEALSRQIIEAATNRLVFLVGVEADQIAFEIRALQEFMAAEALMAGKDEQVRARLQAIAPIISWRNVFLFAAGKCFAEREHLRETIYTLCGELNEATGELHEATSDAVARVTCVGSRLALDLLEDGPARRHPKSARSLLRIALRLLDLPPYGVHSRLAALYEPRFAGLYREEVERRLGSVSSSFSAWACLSRLIDMGAAWADALADQHWSAFGLKHGDLMLWLIDYSRPTQWAKQRLLELIPSMSPLSLRSLRYQSFDNHRPEEAPDWYKGAISAFRNFTPFYDTDTSGKLVPLRFPGLNDDMLQFDFVGLYDSRTWFLTQLQQIPNALTVWQPLIVAGQFVKQPSHHTLASALRLIATAIDEETIDWVIQFAPWPLSTCLVVIETAEQLLRLADRAETGELGTFADWDAAEQRWDKRPLTIADIEHMSDLHWPFDQTIAQYGFPFGGQTGVLFEANLSLLSPLLDVRQRLNQSAIRDQMTVWIVQLIEALVNTSSAESDTLRSLWQRVDVQALVEEAPYLPNTIRFFHALVRASLLDDAWVDQLDRHGQRLHAWEVGGYPPINVPNVSDLADFLSRLVPQHPSRPGLLILLAHTVLTGAQPAIPAALIPLPPRDQPLFRTSAIIVRTALGFEQPADAVGLAHAVAEIVEAHPKLALNLLIATAEHRAATPSDADFLLALWRQTPAHEWQIGAQIIKELDEALSRRTSRLHDAQVWRDLGLPEGVLAA